MKTILSFVLIFFAVIPTFGQHKKAPLKNIDSLVDATFLANSVNIIWTQPSMNANMEKNYQIKIHNGTEKQIVALNLFLDFNEFSYNKSIRERESNTNCRVSKRIKITINRKSNKTFVLNQPDKNLDCHNIPLIIITTIVYADGTFDDFERLSPMDRFLRDNEQKEKIKSELLKQLEVSKIKSSSKKVYYKPTTYRKMVHDNTNDDKNYNLCSGYLYKARLTDTDPQYLFLFSDKTYTDESKRIIQLPEKAEIYVLSESDFYYYVCFHGVSGYISMHLLIKE
jgi:hypothetical protein